MKQLEIAFIAACTAALFLSAALLNVAPKDTTEYMTFVVSAPSKLEERILRLFPNADREVISVVEKGSFYKDFPKKEDVLAIIAQESGFRRCPTDGKGSYGAMQVNLPAHPHLTKDMACDPFSNVQYGTLILREYFLIIGSIQGAILAYNSGIGNYRKGNYNLEYYEGVISKKRTLGN